LINIPFIVWIDKKEIGKFSFQPLSTKRILSKISRDGNANVTVLTMLNPA